MAQTANSKKKKIFDGRYEIFDIIGRGSYSVVYHAKQVISPYSDVALKVLVPSPNFSPERLRHEALAMVSARHKYVVRLDDFHSVGKLSYLAMEYAPNSDLAVYAKKLGGKINLMQAERFYHQMVEALGFMHNIGMFHRDIKPSNILVLNDRQARLADFGVALLPGSLPDSSDLEKGVGTMDYMAPEVFEGSEYLPQTDLYQLAVAFYELIAGKHPFSGKPMAQVLDSRKDKNLTPLIELAPDISSYLHYCIMKSLCYKSEDRFKSASEILDCLEQKQILNSNTKKAKNKDIKKEVKTNSSAIVEKPKEAPKDDLDKFLDDFDDFLDESNDKTEVKTKKPEENVDKTKDLTKAIDKPTAKKSPNEDFFKDDEEEDISKVDSSLEELYGDVDSYQTNSEPFERKKTQTTNPLKETTTIDATQRKAAIDMNAKDGSYVSSKDTAYRSNTKYSKSSNAFSDKEKIKKVLYSLFGLLILWASSKMFLGQNSEEVRINELEIQQEVLVETAEQKSTGEEVNKNNEVVKSVQNLKKSSETSNNLNYNFPNLPSGIFSGELEGLYGKDPILLTIVSTASKKQIIVFLGIEGWTPALINTDEFRDKNLILIKANGFVLELAGSLADDSLKGTFRNIITLSKGTWKAKLQ